ncbi:MAG: signal peptide peptidase SppA, partial [Halobacteriota archaeon]|nr:signal peptide peptidase SppA [Halobacteriota archaeon]
FAIPRERVSVIYVQGTMVSENVPSGAGFASSEQICSELRSISKDPFVKAIVIRINSPGGSPASAQEIVSEIKKIDEDTPVVVSMGDLAASGAYYIAAPADWIVANPDTMTGSIGVVWVFENKEDYFKEEGLNYTVVKSGELKDMGGPWRNLSDEEEAYATKVVMDSYKRFIHEVAEGRNLSISEAEKLGDGRLFLGSEAKDLGLVDDIGNLYDAIDIAAEMGGISGTPDVEYVNQPDLFRMIFGGEMKAEEIVNLRNNLLDMREYPYGRILWIMN